MKNTPALHNWQNQYGKSPVNPPREQTVTVTYD